MATRYPIKFLDAYTREDKDFFFGRQAEIAALYEMVFQTDLLLIYGASGTGKTSLIQCGLANKFEPYDWMPLQVRRRDDLNQSLAEALTRAGGILPTEEEDLSWLAEDFSEESATGNDSKQVSPLAKQLQAIYLQHFKPIYLIFDQFEELYILGNKDEQSAFISTVQDILQVEQPVKIILSIREEYLGYLYEFERAVPELLRKKLRVEPMNLEKVKSVITNMGEADNSNISLAKGEAEALGQGIFDKIRGQQKSLSIPLPYLQVFLDKLYMRITNDESRQTEAIFSIQALDSIGNIDDVLRDFLDEQVLTIARRQQLSPDHIWALLSPFVTLEGTKEPLSEVELGERVRELSQKQLTPLLQALVKGRILRYREEVELYEIAHDSLAKQINAKRSDEEVALLEVRRLIRSQVSIKAEAREYFSGKQLDFMADFLPKLKLNTEEKSWIAASEQYRQELAEAEQRRQREELEATRKRLRLVRGLLALAVLALIGAAYSYYNAKQQEQIAIQKTKETEDALELANDQQAIAEQEKQDAEAARDSIRLVYENFLNEQQQRELAEQNEAIAQERAALATIFERIDGLPRAEAERGIQELNRYLRNNTYPNSRVRIEAKIRALRNQ